MEWFQLRYLEPCTCELMTEARTSTLAEGNDEGQKAKPLRILVVDDDPNVREAIELCLTPMGHHVTPTSSVDHARVAVARRRFDLVLLDLRLGDSSGLQLIPEMLEVDETLLIVVMTAFGSVESAVEAMKQGAFEYINKPVSPAELEILTRRVAERRRTRQRLEALEEYAAETQSPPPILETSSPAMAKAIEVARNVAETDATVLITGESGTGKGVVARAIHEWSPRSSHAFAVVNCPSLSDELLRSELFGHVKGSFTGATANKVGKIEFVDGGTLFLDEVGELARTIQPSLLHFLQTREYERVGDPEPRTADVRLIAATNRELDKAVEAGEFRDDLFYRLNVVRIEVPPLRERPDDIPRIANAFLTFFSGRYGRRIEGFTDAALKALRELEWPGNVRELQNAVERAVILAKSSRIGANALPGGGSSGLLAQLDAQERDDLPTLEGMEERYIRHVMDVTDSVEEAAEVLGVAPSTLWRRRRKYGI